jgi:shikimate kinase
LADAQVDSPLVVLIGPMASGKTRIGRRVAKLLNVPFIDTDKRIVAEYGPIPALFETHGEAHFRTLERAAVAQALTKNAVVSLGGGAPMDVDSHRRLLHQPVVLLTITKDAVGPRILGGDRPMLTAGIDSWVQLNIKRMPTYLSLAKATWDTSSRPADLIAQEIADWAGESSS